MRSKSSKSSLNRQKRRDHRPASTKIDAGQSRQEDARHGRGASKSKTAIDGLLDEFASLQFSINCGTASNADVGRAFAIKEILAQVDKELTNAPPDWDSLPSLTASVWITDIPTSKHGLFTKCEPLECSSTVQIKIASHPFARGGVRAAYYARVQKPGGPWKPYVLKMFLEPKNQTKEQYLDQLETNGVAKYLAKQFMRSTLTGKKAAKINQKIKFIESRAVRATKENGQVVWYNMENVIDGEFDKWTDNNGVCNPKPENRTLLEFAKWTHEWTDGFMMATDLQGGKTSGGWVLTDPAMLCQDLSRFGPTNFNEAQLTMCYGGALHALRNGRSLIDGTPGSSYKPGFSRHDDGSLFAAAIAAFVESTALPAEPSLPASILGVEMRSRRGTEAAREVCFF